MNVVNWSERSCEKYRRYFDAYLDNELLVETNQDVIQHLSSCTECSRIIETRARVKNLVKDSVSAQVAPLELVASLQHQLQSKRRSSHAPGRWMMAAAALLLFAAGIVGVVQWGRIIRFRNDSAFQVVSARVQQILHVGLADHLHCAIRLERWKGFVSFEDMKAQTDSAALGPQFIDLVPAVQSKLGTDYRIVQGHRCTSNHRHYVHLILTGSNGAILSLVITEKQNESFTQADAVAVVEASGIPIYSDRQDEIEVAGFESDKYLAFIVSNMNRGSNLNAASALASVVYRHLKGLEL